MQGVGERTRRKGGSVGDAWLLAGRRGCRERDSDRGHRRVDALEGDGRRRRGRGHDTGGRAGGGGDGRDVLSTHADVLGTVVSSSAGLGERDRGRREDDEGLEECHGGRRDRRVGEEGWDASRRKRARWRERGAQELDAGEGSGWVPSKERRVGSEGRRTKGQEGKHNARPLSFLPRQAFSWEYGHPPPHHLHLTPVTSSTGTTRNRHIGQRNMHIVQMKQLQGREGCKRCLRSTIDMPVGVLARTLTGRDERRAPPS